MVHKKLKQVLVPKHFQSRARTRVKLHLIDRSVLAPGWLMHSPGNPFGIKDQAMNFAEVAVVGMVISDGMVRIHRGCFGDNLKVCRAYTIPTQ